MWMCGRVVHIYTYDDRIPGVRERQSRRWWAGVLGYGLDHLKDAGNKATSVVVGGGSGRTVPTRRTNGANKESERR